MCNASQPLAGRSVSLVLGSSDACGRTLGGDEARLDTMEAAITCHHMAIFSSDIMISVPRNSCFMHEFYRASQVIALGEDLANEALASADMERRQKEF